jgi:hypothetical protein
VVAAVADAAQTRAVVADPVVAVAVAQDCTQTLETVQQEQTTMVVAVVVVTTTTHPQLADLVVAGTL